ncbi:MAG: DUF3352 domain-containing protein [Dehalococcoidia bacterium]
MSQPRRLYSFAVAAVLAVAGVTVAGFVLFTSGKASNVDLTSARYVPADAGAYIGFNTDLASTQWIAAFAFAKRLGQKNPRQELHQSASDAGGLDWSKQIAPFLGGNAAVYVRSFDFAGAAPQGAAIIRCANAGSALSVIEHRSGANLQNGSHAGVSYRFDSDMPLYLARLDDHLVIAMDERSLFDVIDVHAGKKPALAGVADFKTLRDELTNSFLGFVYVSTDALLRQSEASAFPWLQALQSAGSSGLSLKPSAVVIGARSGSMEFQSASIGSGGQTSALMRPRTSRFAGLVPADTAVFVSTAGVADTWKAFKVKSRGQIDQALQDGGYDTTVDDVLQTAAHQLGLSSLDEAINLFSGEVAVAGWAPASGGSDLAGVMLAEVGNEQQARTILATLVQSAGSVLPTTAQVGKAAITVLPGDGSTEYAYTVTDGYLAFGTRAGLETLLTQQGATLADTDAYKRTVAQSPTKLGTFAYIDVGALIRQARLPTDQIGGAGNYLQGLIVNLVEERGISRLSGVLTAQQ